MFRVFLTGSYKKPREFNWNIGVLLLVFTLLLSFTGYLLPDDQLGFWAVTVGTNMARATPLLGHEGPFGKMLGMTPYNDVRFGLLGGSVDGRECVAALLHLALHRHSDCGFSLDDRAFLARKKRRRDFRPSASDADRRSR